MKRKVATRVIALLILVVLVMQVVEKRNDLQCYVMQQATRHDLVFTAGFATADEIREIVWNDTVADFHGQSWRASLDQIFHAIFMGGNRGNQVVAWLLNSADEPNDFSCAGTINWAIWDDRDFTVLENFSSSDIETWHAFTTALRAIPKEDLQHYKVSASDLSNKYSADERGSTSIWQHRDAGEASAQAWLRGDIVLEYWSAWYASWLENVWELQETYKK